MKLGIIFKKQFRERFGDKKEFFSDEITIKQEMREGVFTLTISMSCQVHHIPIGLIQLIYFGGWNE